MNKPISAIFVKVKVDMLGLIVHDSLDITSVNMSWDYLRTLALVVKRKIWPLSFKITLLHFKAAVLSFLYLT